MKTCIKCGHAFESKGWVCPCCGKEPMLREGFLSFIDGTTQDLESFDKGYFPELYKLEHDHFWFKYRNTLILWALHKYFPNVLNILEIGCGTGYALSELSRCNHNWLFSGSDLYSEGLRFAKQRVSDADFYQMDACAIPFMDEFDLIMALDILEHIEDDVAVLREIYRALKTGGGLVLTVPQHRWLWSMHDEKAYHKRRYTWKELERKMVSCGFHMVHHTAFISFLVPVMMASRLSAGLMSNNQKGYNPLRELKISPVLNQIGSAICTMEGLLLKRGIRLPTGGSLLCVAVK